MNVLITGITGFIGRALTERLRSDSHHVYGVVRHTTKQTLVKGATLLAHDGSMQSMLDILNYTTFDIVYHLAACFRAEHCEADVTELVTSNLLFGTQLLEAMKLTKTPRLVNVGTVWQTAEGLSNNPSTLYAATKEAFEVLAEYYSKKGRPQCITLKLTDVYGPNDKRRKVLNIIHQHALEVEKLQKSHQTCIVPDLPMSGGDQLLDLVHVDDVVDALVAANTLMRTDTAEYGARYRTRLVSSDAPITLKVLVDSYEKATGRHVLAQWGALPYRKYEMFESWQADPLLEGWNPKLSLADGLKTL